MNNWYKFQIIFNNIFYIYKHYSKTAAVAQWVWALAPQAEGRVFE